MATKKNEIAIVEPATPEIRSLIYVVRGVQVMLDSDLARLYHVETGRMNEAVNRNISRFPKRFCFKLTLADVENLESQFVHPGLREETIGRGGRRYLPYVFTEQGIAMLSTVLRSDVAIKVSINIMDAFTEMRRFIANNAAMFERISAVELRQLQYQQQTDEKLDKIFTYISDHKESAQKIFFDGQIYDAFSLLVRLIQEANKEILLIDSHVDVGTLNLLCKKNDKVSVTIYTHNKTKLSASDTEKFNEQYPSLTVKYTHAFHDRFLILDKKTAYHIGASLKDAGKKCFAVSRIQDSGLVKGILQRLKQTI